MLNESLPDNLSQDATTMAHPPEMPIVIDEAAIKDILGVLSNFCISAMHPNIHVFFTVFT